MSDQQEVIGRLDLEVFLIALFIVVVGVDVLHVGVGFGVCERDKTSQAEASGRLILWRDKGLF